MRKNVRNVQSCAFSAAIARESLVEIFQHLAKHCGIGAEVVVGGTIRVGDALEGISGK